MFRDRLFDSARSLQGDYEAVDWAATPLGAPTTWSLALRNTVDLALHTDFPVTLLWGPEFVLVYNEAYAELIADKHPWALGRTAEEIFPEAWDVIGPMMNGVYAGEGRANNRDLYLPLQRRGRLEEAYFDFSYSPVRGADGLIEGVIDITAETTGRVIAGRRLGLLADLRELTATVEHEDELRERALAQLRAAENDFPRVELQPVAEPALPTPPRVPDDLAIATTAAGRVAWLPLGESGDWLAVVLSEHLAEDDSQLEFLELIAVTLGQALTRVSARETERDIAQVERRMSETLQQSMLTRPTTASPSEVATHYVAAAEQAYVGGDWYDAFDLSDSTRALVIGDVVGHDGTSAAAMAQVKSMLRALTVARRCEPGEVLAQLDEVMIAVDLDVYASAVLACVSTEDGRTTLRWANAGHPPPVLVRPDGDATLLERDPELMLGVATGPREDHAIELEPGSSVVFYTDGLVERRGTLIDDGFDRVCALASRHAGLAADELSDKLLAELALDAEDDVALLVLRVP